MTSDRQRRLDARLADINNREHVAQTRLRNAERGLRDHLASTTVYPPQAEALYRDEVDAANAAILALWDERAAIMAARDWHTTDLPNGALLSVTTRDGDEYLIERSDDLPDDFAGTWYRAGEPDTPLAFDEAIGVNDGADFGACGEFHRLYTAGWVDDLLDQLGVDDLYRPGREVA